MFVAVFFVMETTLEGWIKLNSDGACKDMGHIFVCGGIFHDADGKWIKGSTKKIGACDVLHAEM